MADKPKALHAKQRPSRTKVVVGLAAVVVVAAVGATAYSLNKSSSPLSNAIGGTPKTPTTVEALSLLVTPPDGATNVGIDTVISVTAMNGHLNAVTVAGADGRSVSGSVTAGGATWRSSANLALKTDYTVTVDARMPSGRSTQQVSHFKSLVPTATLGVTITPEAGTTVGIGQPIVLRFDHAVTNKNALLATLKVTESTPVSGGWRWFSSRELHFRPEVYWPPGEKVSIAADLTDFDAGAGIWGTGKATGNFVVGDAHVTKVDVQSDQMTVTSNGQTVYTFPISAGRTKYPTMGGIHLDLYRQQDVHMVSSSVGIPVNSADGYDEHVYWDVNISDGGEYVHAAPWSTGAQGRSNVSHGCVNLSVANAQAFYNFSRIGDIIDVVNSPRKPDAGDHGTMDWNTPFSAFTPATAVSPTAASAAPASGAG